MSDAIVLECVPIMPFRRFNFPVPNPESTARQRYTLALVITIIGFAFTLALNYWTDRQSFQVGVVAVVLSAWFGCRRQCYKHVAPGRTPVG